MEVLLHARGLGQLQQGSCGVHPRRKDEDERSGACGFFHNLRKRERVSRHISGEILIVSNNTSVQMKDENIKCLVIHSESVISKNTGRLGKMDERDGR